MNPFDAVGTARIAAAVYDRCCRLAMGYQDAGEEAADRRCGRAATPPRRSGRARSLAAVAMVRDSRAHPDVRTGSSVRGRDRLRAGRPRAGRRCAGAERPGPRGHPRRRAARPVRAGSGCGRAASRTARGGRRPSCGGGTSARPGRRGRRRPDGRRRVRRKSLSPPPGGGRTAGDADQGGRGRAGRRGGRGGRRTTSRRDLARHERFDEISPEVGRARRGRVRRAPGRRPRRGARPARRHDRRHRRAPPGPGPAPGRPDHGRPGPAAARPRAGASAGSARRAAATDAAATSTWTLARRRGRWPGAGGRPPDPDDLRGARPGSGPTPRCACWSTGPARWPAHRLAAAAVAAAAVAFRAPARLLGGGVRARTPSC